MDDTRRMLDEVFAADDAARADFEAWQVRQPIKRRDAGDMSLVYKTQPVQQQQSAMDETTSAAWNEWADSKICNAVDIIGEEVGLIQNERVKKSRSCARKLPN